MKILLADDDKSIAMVVEHIVSSLGYDFIYAKDGKEAIEMFNAQMPNLVILDVMMPKIDGFDVCNIIRLKSDVPIIFLTAKSDIVDKSMGFCMGADDYLVKPFAPIELKLRIEVLLKRIGKQAEIEKNQIEKDFLEYKDLKIDFNHYQVFLKDEEVFLTFKEFSLLSLLAKHPGQVFSRTQIIDTLWGKDYMGEINALALLVHKIRGKIEENPNDPEYLLTVWGVGYKFGN